MNEIAQMQLKMDEAVDKALSKVADITETAQKREEELMGQISELGDKLITLNEANRKLGDSV